MTAAGESTDVQVDTDLAITGKPAQFGRGVMQDVSDKLLGQFVSCLEQRLGASEPAAPEGSAEPEEPASPDSSAPDGPPPAPPPAPAAARTAPPPSSPAPRPAPAAAGADDSLDLGATVLPVLLRTYGPRLAAVLGLVALLVVVRRMLR